MDKAAKMALVLNLRSYKKARPPFNTELGKKLPKAYRKFWYEWKVQKPEPVHFKPEPGKWKRDEKTGVVTPVQNVPLPLKFPQEFHQFLLGGENMVLGFVKKGRFHRRVPRMWMPTLSRSVVYSEILNKYLSLVITERVVHLIHKHYGFDNYILSTPACDIQSELGVALKRKLLLALQKKEIGFDDVQKQQEIYDKYKHHLDKYTQEELEWYGLSLKEALTKLYDQIEVANTPRPLKHQYRTDFIRELLEREASKATSLEENEKSASWLSKINPFADKGKDNST